MNPMFDLPPELSGLVLPQYRQAMIPKEPVELPWSDDKSWETWLKDPIWKRRAFTADKDHMNSVLMSKPLGDLLAVAYLKSIRTHVHRNGLSYLSSFTGPHRSAKSVSASLFAHILDSTMWDAFESRIIQSPYQFMTCMKGIIDDEIIGASVVVDEAGTTFSSGDWYEKWMKVIQKFLQTCGMLKPKLFFVAPNREFIVSGMRKLIIAEHHMKKFKPEFSRMSCYHVKYNFMKKGDPYFFRRPVIRIAGQNITLKHINIFEPPKWFVDRYRNLTEPDKRDRMSKWTKEAQKLISGQEEEEEDIDYDTLIEEVWQNKGTFFGRVNREGLPVIEQNTLEIELGIKPKQAKYIKERIDKRLRQAKAEADELNREKNEKAEQDAREASEQRMAGLKKKLVDDIAPPKTEERKEQKEKMYDALEELLSATDD